MKLITQDLIKIIIADEGKMLISKHDNQLTQLFPNQKLLGLSPLYYKEIVVSIDYTEEQMSEDFTEIEIAE
jgi:hypothetical protein